jgi:hypothetical protein
VLGWWVVVGWLGGGGRVVLGWWVGGVVRGWVGGGGVVGGKSEVRACVCVCVCVIF